MAGILSSLLADYSLPQDGTPSGIAVLRPIKTEIKPEPELKPNPVDHQAELIRKAEAKARREEKDLAQKALEEALSAERSRFEEELKAQRVIWAEQEGAQLSLQFAESLANLENALSGRVATILSSLVSEALRQQTITDFEAALRAMLSNTSSQHLRVTGPQDILSVIESRMGARGGAIEFVPSDDVEVTVVSQDTVVETQFSSWLSRLDNVLKAGC